MICQIHAFKWHAPRTEDICASRLSVMSEGGRVLIWTVAGTRVVLFNVIRPVYIQWKIINAWISFKRKNLRTCWKILKMLFEFVSVGNFKLLKSDGRLWYLLSIFLTSPNITCLASAALTHDSNCAEKHKSSWSRATATQIIRHKWKWKHVRMRYSD